MRRSTGVCVILGLALAGCTRLPESAPPSAIPSPAGGGPSTVVPDSDIRFLLGDAYSVGDRIPVRIENVGHVAYRYQPFYQACFLDYLDPRGRKFIIPPGTHCDMLGQAIIRPGETKRLFAWDLDECVKDSWGCVKSRALDPGTYTIRGTFRPVREGEIARAQATFDIQLAG